jgi:3-methyladenine DNA glycosylase AlkD
MSFINDLEKDFRQHSNPEMAAPMEAYMKNKFSFLGIKTEMRRALLNKHWKAHKDEVKTNYRAITWELFQMKEREFHQCAIDILTKEIKKNYQIDDIDLIEQFLITNSWWDSVDTLAKYVLGNYLLQYPSEIYKTVERFSNSSNMWLNRSAILFQLSYKDKTDFELLQSLCEHHKESKEFFIQKAIGWVLRDYSRYNPIGVKNYVAMAKLKPLSEREALRLLKL